MLSYDMEGGKASNLRLHGWLPRGVRMEPAKLQYGHGRGFRKMFGIVTLCSEIL